ncbi:MAG: nuclear transport factor 2 family protein [Candidatus Nanopelagicales bacterium]
MTHPAAGLERHLLDPAVRADAEALAQLLHPDFTEIGASGRRWNRAQVISALVAEPHCSQDLRDLHTDELAYGIAMVTYDLDGTRRMSLWVKEVTRWYLRYHQGTPIS